MLSQICRRAKYSILTEKFSAKCSILAFEVISHAFEVISHAFEVISHASKCSILAEK